MSRANAPGVNLDLLVRYLDRRRGSGDTPPCAPPSERHASAVDLASEALRIGRADIAVGVAVDEEHTPQIAIVLKSGSVASQGFRAQTGKIVTAQQATHEALTMLTRITGALGSTAGEAPIAEDISLVPMPVRKHVSQVHGDQSAARYSTRSFAERCAATS